MSHPVESPEKKELPPVVHSFKQEAEELKKVQNEVKGMPLEKEFEAWVAAYNLRIRKMQRDAITGQEKENADEIGKLIIDVPLGAYIVYLQEELKNIYARYNQAKKEYDQCKEMHGKLKEEHDTLLRDAEKEKDPVKAEKLMATAEKKGEEVKEKKKEMLSRKWIIQNEVASRLFPDLERDMRYVEVMVGKMSGTEAQEQKKLNDALGGMKKTMRELQSKTQKDTISSEDRMSDYFHTKSNK